MVGQVSSGEEPDIQLVPVTVLIGRAPDKETGLAKIFFTESWEIGGRINRFINSLINGRSTMVQYSPPISLRELTDEGLGASRSLRKVSRILRVHFRLVRSAAIGPDLSHRRTVVDRILNSQSVRSAIAESARKKKTTEHKARKQARKYAYEIAADYSYAFVRIVSFNLGWFWNKIYDGVVLQHFRSFQKLAPEYEVIYVPCHRSHIDYLLVSYLLYNNGLVAPHVACINGIYLCGLQKKKKLVFKTQKICVKLDSGFIFIDDVSSEDQLANILTNGLNNSIFLGLITS